MGKGKMGKYLLYAIGEIVLVVAGILIALTINNANEEKKEKAALTAIFSDIKADLILDTTVVGQMIPFYEAREKIADSIVAGKFTRAAFEQCGLCHSMLTTYVPFTINDKGYNQLRGFNQAIGEKDTLAVEAAQFYKIFLNAIEGISEQVKADTYETLKLWRNTQPWFSEIINGKLPEGYMDYVSESPDYKNRIAFWNIIACKNLLVGLKQYNAQAKELIKRIDARGVAEADQDKEQT